MEPLIHGLTPNDATGKLLAVRVLDPGDGKAGGPATVILVGSDGAVLAALPVTVASMPLPTGAATEATQLDVRTNTGDTAVAVTDIRTEMTNGPHAPGVSESTVAAQSLPVCWQIPTITGAAAAKPLVSAWASGTAYVVGQAVTNDTGKLYVCITAGTSAGSGGPTGTGANITDNTAHWSYVAASATAFKGSIILRNTDGTNTLSWSSSAALAPGGSVVPAGQPDPIYYADATGIYVYSASGASASVTAYP